MRLVDSATAAKVAAQPFVHETDWEATTFEQPKTPATSLIC